MAKATKANHNTPKNKPIIKMKGQTKLASTIVEQGPRDDLTRVDGYGKKISPLPTSPNLTLNKYTDDFYQGYTNLAGALGLSKINLLNPTGLNTIAGAMKNMVDTVQDYKKRIENNLLGGRSLESLVDVAADFKDNALGAMVKYGSGFNIAGMDLGQMIRTGAMAHRDAMGIYNVVKSGDWKTLGGIKAALEAIGGHDLARVLSPIIDVNAISAFMGTMMHQAARLGLTDVITKISGLFKSKSARDKALDSAMYNAALRSDMFMMEDILKILPPDALNSNNPKMIQWILSNFKVDPFYTPAKIKEYRNRLLKILNTVNPKWYYQMFGNNKVYLLEPFIGITNDARMLLNYQDSSDGLGVDFKDIILLAPNYRGTDIKRALMTMYNEITFPNIPKDPKKKYND